LTAETKYGGTVTNVKRKRVSGGASSYSKTTKAGDAGLVGVQKMLLVLLLVRRSSWVCHFK